MVIICWTLHKRPQTHNTPQLLTPAVLFDRRACKMMVLRTRVAYGGFYHGTNSSLRLPRIVVLLGWKRQGLRPFLLLRARNWINITGRRGACARSGPEAGRGCGQEVEKWWEVEKWIEVVWVWKIVAAQPDPPWTPQSAGGQWMWFGHLLCCADELLGDPRWDSQCYIKSSNSQGS